jgi:ribosomal protein S18 acetylase RimI-like enzyme
MTQSQFEMTPISSKHFAEIAELQVCVLPEDLFSLFGKSQLEHAVYPYVMNFVAESRVAVLQHRVVGFAFLLSKSFLNITFLAKCIRQLILVAIRRPRIFVGSAKALLSRPRGLPQNELLWVCVQPEFQGIGIGRTLVKDLAKAFATKNHESILVRTLEKTPENIRFYESLGFQIVGISSGRVWLVLPNYAPHVPLH